MAGGMSDYLEGKLLDYVLGATAFAVTGPWFLGLFTDRNTKAQRDAGTFTEVTGGSYARVSITNNTTNWPATSAGNPSTKSNGAVFTFPTPTANWGTITGWFLADAVSAGNVLFWGDLTSQISKIATVTAAAPGVFTVPAHGYANGNVVIVTAIDGLALPTGITSGVAGTVAGAATDTFNIGTTTTTTGVALVTLDGSQAVVTGNTVQFSAGQLIVSGD